MNEKYQKLYRETREELIIFYNSFSEKPLPLTGPINLFRCSSPNEHNIEKYKLFVAYYSMLEGNYESTEGLSDNERFNDLRRLVKEIKKAIKKV